MNLKKLITQVFIEIGNNEGFDNVTINKVIKACNISRSSFYYYFKDLPDVIDYYLGEKIADALLECSRIKNVNKSTEYLAENIIYNFPEYKKLWDSKWRIQAETFLHNHLKKSVEEMMYLWRKENAIKGNEKKFLTDFLSSAICDFIIFGDHQEIGVKEYTEQLSFLLEAIWEKLEQKY